MDLTSLHRFHVAPGYDPAAPDTWVWEDRSADVDHVDGGVTITGGRADEVSQIDAGSARLRLDNAGGHYCTDNPNGRWFGRLSRGCPARWGTISGAEAFGTTSSNGWGTPDVGTSWTHNGTLSEWSASSGVGQKVMATANVANTAILVGADCRNGDATWVFYTTVVATGASLIYGMVARYASATDHLYFTVDLDLAGVVVARIRRQNGVSYTTIATATLGFTYSASQRLKMRCQWDGPALRMKVWPEASSEPTSWSLTATDSLCTGTGVGVKFWRLVGNTNAGSVTFFADDIEIEAVEIVGTVPEWPVRWDPTATVSWAPIQIAGVTRRLAQGEEALKSPIYRQLQAQNPMAWLPLEDGSDANVAASGVPGGQQGTVSDVSFGGTDCPAGASAAATLNSTASRIALRAPKWTVPLDGYAGMMYFRFPSLPGGTGVPLFELRVQGTVVRWVVKASTTVLQLDGYDASGTSIVAPASSFYAVDPTRWTALQLETSESGGTVNYALIWHQVGGTSFYVINGSYSGSADRITSATVYAPVAGTLVSHLWLGDDALPFVDGTFMAVSAGYAGELAADRVARLCREEGVSVGVEPGGSEPLGVQRAAGFLTLMREAEAADLGVLYEDGTGLGYRPRAARYNRSTDFAIAIAATGDIGEQPEPTDDDQRVRNYWTVNREGGSSATAEDVVHKARHGRYPDSATVNIRSDGRLLDHASWRVHLGTWGEYRWPQLNLVLTDRDGLIASWRGRRFGPRITVTGVPSQGPIGKDLDLIVEGWSQEITSHSWRVTLNCSPAKPWDVGVYDTSRKDSATTSLGVSRNTTDTSWTFSTTSPLDVWTTNPARYPLDVSCGGERVRITAMGAVSGSGPYAQTATVTRSINGVVKSQGAGSVIRLWTPATKAL